jgi:hypothetical protein
MEQTKAREEISQSMAKPSIMETVGEMAHTMFQSFKPINQLCMNLSGFHCYASDPNRQLSVHHFCTHLKEDMYQCIIFDKNSADAKLIGIEYVVHKRLYDKFPQEEKKYWHPHSYEVLSGQLMGLGVPTMIEDRDMKWLVNSYGKTWHTWEVDRHELPFGEPKLMKTFTADGQLNPELVAQRDLEWKVSTPETRKHRESTFKDIEPVDPNALF